MHHDTNRIISFGIAFNKAIEFRFRQAFEKNMIQINIHRGLL